MTSHVVSIRLPKTEHNVLMAVADRRGVPLSTLIRKTTLGAIKESPELSLIRRSAETLSRELTEAFGSLDKAVQTTLTDQQAALNAYAAELETETHRQRDAIEAHDQTLRGVIEHISTLSGAVSSMKKDFDLLGSAVQYALESQYEALDELRSDVTNTLRLQHRSIVTLLRYIMTRENVEKEKIEEFLSHLNKP